jgi:hypothetical protein
MRIVCLTQRARGSRRASVGRSRRIVALVGCLALALLGTRTYADTDTALRHFDIQSQVAALALKEFARQADISLVFSSTAVAHRQTTGIRGDFTVIDGLRKLLDGSGLAFKQVSATTIAINIADTTSANTDPPADDPASGTATNNSQTKGDPNMSNKGFFTRMASLLALSGAVLAGHAYGQDAASTTGQAAAGEAAPVDASAADTNDLQEVVVTATANGGLKKLDASFQITTASLE